MRNRLSRKLSRKFTAQTITGQSRTGPALTTRRLALLTVWLGVVCGGLCGSVSPRPIAAGERADAAADAGALTFEQHVRPLLKARCFHCHGENEGEQDGNLDLRLVRFMQQGGDSGPAIVPGQPDESYLLQRVLDGDMPPDEDAIKLTAREIGTIRRWIAAGAPTARPEPDTLPQGFLITQTERIHWAFQPLQRPEIPDVANDDLLQTPIDAFILARLEAEGLQMSPQADRRTLARRLSVDLTGLLPTPEDVAAFVADDRPDAYTRLVDRLLSSPSYGERWGRHWLDLAGYADSEGYTDDDVPRKWAWKYRDYVIRAFNDNKPYDTFLVEQLAGDELNGTDSPQPGAPASVDPLIATGFLRMAPDGTGQKVDEADVAKNEVIADTIEIMSTAVLGLTVGCARCHNHRYDPISQADYYRLRAILEPAYDWTHWRTPQQRLVSLYTEQDRLAAEQYEAEAREIEKRRSALQAEFIEKTFERELAKLPEAMQAEVREARETPEKQRTPAQKALLKKHPSVNVSASSLYLYDRKAADELKKLADEAKAVRDQKPQEEFVRALTEPTGAELPVSYVFHRGDHQQLTEQVEPGELTILALDRGACEIPENDTSRPTSGRRLAYARQLVDGTHPLTARVIVNRVWLHHFGRGLVNTPGDFGLLGEPPSHPELLDWLAVNFMDAGWDLKWLHRLILNSATYRQALLTDTQHLSVDPDNRLFGGARLRRLQSEVVRDSMLRISGQLNRKPFGPPVPVMADRVGQFVIGIENLNAGRPGDVIPMHGEEFRRSVFVQARRSRPLAVLATFDLPRMAPNCVTRPTSTVATQSLMLMNSQFAVACSRQMAQRVIEQVPETPAARIRGVWQHALARDPDPDELRQAAEFLERQQAEFARRLAETQATDAKSSEETLDAATLALSTLAQAVLSSNEFLYID